MKNILSWIFEKATLFKKSENSLFHKLLEQYPDKKYCMEYKDTIYFSIGYETIYYDINSREYTRELNEETTSFGFYDFTEVEYDLFCAFLDSPFAQQVTELSLGWTSSYCGYEHIMVKAINQLGKANLPNLKNLNLGVFLLFSNSASYHHNIGDITKALQKHNSIEYLTLGGDFQLTQPILFDRLKKLTLEGWICDDVAVLTSDKAFQALINCSMPALIEAELDLHREDEDITFTFPSRFLNKETFPSLQKLYLSGRFPTHQWEKIENSYLVRTTTDVTLDK